MAPAYPSRGRAVCLAPLPLARPGPRSDTVAPVSFSGLLAASSQLLPAREQMAFTLGFHIVLASMGVAFPAITLIANYRGVRKGDEAALTLAQRWSKVMAVLFAVGAVTGTVLSFEFGLLWPPLMKRYGQAFGIGFAIEGLFFF